MVWLKNISEETTWKAIWIGWHVLKCRDLLPETCWSSWMLFRFTSVLAEGLMSPLGRVRSTSSSTTLLMSTSASGEVAGAFSRVRTVGRNVSSTTSWWALSHKHHLLFNHIAKRGSPLTQPGGVIAGRPALAGVELEENSQTVAQADIVLSDRIVPQQHQAWEHLCTRDATRVHQLGQTLCCLRPQVRHLGLFNRKTFKVPPKVRHK